MAKKSQPKPEEKEPVRIRQFESWVGGASDRVLWRITKWMQNYQSTAAGAVPVNPRKWVPPNRDEFEAVAITTRYKHQISFNLNELRWLKSILSEEDPTMPIALLFEQAYANHLDHVKKNPNYTGEWPQWYDVTEAEVKYVYMLLTRLRIGRPTPGQEKERQADIGKGDW